MCEEESGRWGFNGGVVLDQRGLWIQGTPLTVVHTVFVLDFNSSDRHWFYIILSSSVTESDLAARHSKINTQERQMLVESKAGFNQNAGSLGEMVNSVSPTTTSQDSAWPWKVLRRKGDGISVKSLRWAQSRCCAPMCRLVMQTCSCSLVLMV